MLLTLEGKCRMTSINCLVLFLIFIVNLINDLISFYFYTIIVGIRFIMLVARGMKRVPFC